jgi:thiamine transport system substrate-binding protein
MNTYPLVATTILLAASLAGCLGASDSDCTSAAENQSSTDFKGQRLTILDQGAMSYMFAAIEPVFENLTGADLVLIDGGDAGTALRTALLSAGNPPADLIFGVDNALFFTEGVREKCLFLPYDSPHLSAINESIVDVDQFRVDGALWATPVDHAYVSVNYDIRLDDEANGSHGPKDLRELAQAKWASTFAIPDPRFSSPGLLFLLASIATFGESGDYDWKAYWSDLLENGALIANDWTSAYVYHFTAGYGQYNDTTFVGGRQVVVSYTTSPAVEVYFGTPQQPSVSVEPARGVMPQFETLAILRGTQHQALAQAFIDFALTAEFQSNNAPAMAVYPVIDGVELPTEFNEIATDPGELELADLTPAQIDANLDRWIDEWVDLYQEHRA